MALTHAQLVAAEFKEILHQYPEPQIQVLRLLNLPPELLFHIMEVAGMEGARLLGSTCKLLRAISLPFIYRVRRYCTCVIYSNILTMIPVTSTIPGICPSLG
jgi:hypothetical protein